MKAIGLIAPTLHFLPGKSTNNLPATDHEGKDLTVEHQERKNLAALAAELPGGEVSKICEREGCSRLSAVLRCAALIIRKNREMEGQAMEVGVQGG